MMKKILIKAMNSTKKEKKEDNIKDFLNIKNATDDSAELYIYGDIVSDSWGQWMSEDVYPEFVKDFMINSKNKDLDIYINSCGGSVIAGFAIYNILKRHNGKITCHIDGIAASISSVIALAADKIVMPENAYLMIHNPWVSISGSSKELREAADSLDVLGKSIKDIYLENSYMTEEELQLYMDNETWFTGKEASKLFNKIELINSIDAVASISELKYKHKPKNILNKDIEKEEKENLLMELELL